MKALALALLAAVTFMVVSQASHAAIACKPNRYCPGVGDGSGGPYRPLPIR